MIHPSAIIATGAQLGTDVEVGPFAVIDAHVQVGDRCRIGPHVYLTGHTTIGAETRIHTGAVIGDEPQDLHYDGGESYTVLGRNCLIREYVTIHRGHKTGNRTVLGDRCMLMGFSHVGHDCCLGNDVVIANATLLAGHVQIGDRAFISGACAVHQFCRIGTLAMIGGHSGIGQDVPPYALVRISVLCGPNTVGLRRAGFDSKTRMAIRGAIKLCFFSGLNRVTALERLQAEYKDVAALEPFIQFIATTKRGLISRTTKTDDADAAAAE